MSPFKKVVAICAFEFLYFSQVFRVFRPGRHFRGVIFTLHRVLPEPAGDFAPNSILQVTPEFLDKAIKRVRRRGFEIVSLDEAVARIQSNKRQKPFAVFTFDDGYKDNLQYALPVLQANQCPFTLFITTSFIDGGGEIWWQALEDVIQQQKAIACDVGQGLDYIDTETVAQKHAAFKMLYSYCRKVNEDKRVEFIKDLTAKYNVDLHAHCRDLAMTWDELDQMAKDPLCSIGVHTVRHYELSKLPKDQALAELRDSKKVLQTHYGFTHAHFAFPIGSKVAASKREFELAKDLGFTSAVTTRPGGIYTDHQAHLHSLPRISLNSNFQAPRYVDVMLSSVFRRLVCGFSRLNVS